MQARKNYERLANIASKLFFVINDFNRINNMYQFSLDSYKFLFAKCIENYMIKGTTVNDSLPEKLNQISKIHIEEVYKYACRGLFE